MVEHQTTWDLLAIVIVGGLTGLAYRAANRVLDRQAMILLVLTVAVAAIIAVAATRLVAF